MRCNKCDRIARKDLFWENESVGAYFSRPDFRGHTVIVLKRHVEHLAQLTEKEATNFMQGWIIGAKALQKVINPDHINYQINCNWVRHIHGHLYPRFKDESGFGDPIRIPLRDEKFEPKELTEEEKKQIIEEFHKGLG